MRKNLPLLTDKQHIQKLVDIGLTKLEARMYLLISLQSPTTVKTISQKLNVMTSSVHRTLKGLKSKGLVTTSTTKPLTIRAVSPSIALPQLVTKSHLQQDKIAKELETALGRQALGQSLKVVFLESKQAAFFHGINTVANTKKEIMIFSVGEPIPEELFLAFVRAIQRGVDVKMIAQKYDKTNRELLENWKKNGYKVRHITAPELDFTLVVYDKKVAELHIRAPENPDDRLGIVIYNSQYASAQYHYLMGFWEKAKEI
jgi:HTH-type transcriptional regulator, sugar sensing transcriptional regulator